METRQEGKGGGSTSSTNKQKYEIGKVTQQPVALKEGKGGIHKHPTLNEAEAGVMDVKKIKKICGSSSSSSTFPGRKES